MRLDIRTPIGGMFACLGLILVLFGVFTAGQVEMYGQSLGINVNLWWGLVMLAFGAVMLLLGRRAARRAPERPVRDVNAPPGDLPPRGRGH